MPIPTTLSGGGIGVVVLAPDFEMPRLYAHHPQLVPMQATNFAGDHADEISQKIPPNTRIVFMAGDIPSNVFGSLRTALTRRQVPFVHRRNTYALQDALAAAVPAKPDIVPDAPSPHTDHLERDTAADGAAATAGVPRAKGSVKAFVEAEADLNASAAEEARRLLPIAAARGLPTTFGSLAQAISQAKRHGGRTGTPKSIMSAQQRALITLDEAIAGLSLVREYVADTEKLNVELQEKVKMFKGLAAKLMEE